MVIKYYVASRDHQGQGEYPNGEFYGSLTLVFFGRLGCEMDHPGALDRQDAPDGFPASGRNAYLSGANTFFADVANSVVLNISRNQD